MTDHTRAETFFFLQRQLDYGKYALPDLLYGLWINLQINKIATPIIYLSLLSPTRYLMCKCNFLVPEGKLDKALSAGSKKVSNDIQSVLPLKLILVSLTKSKRKAMSKMCC